MGSRDVNDLLSQLPAKVRKSLPDPEPAPPSEGYVVRVSRPFIADGAKEKVADAIECGIISSATTVVQELEQELCRFYGVSMAKACSSGCSALIIALRLARVGQGDDVLIPSLTMVAVLNAVLNVGAKPVFVDCAEGCLNPTVAEYATKITQQTRALVVTHTYGIPADCIALQKFCQEKNLMFIEDIAEAIGTKCNEKLVGTFGDFACASLYANKAITSGDGGFVLSTRSDGDLKERADSYANHGFTKDYHFVHFESATNHKMSGLEAALVTPAVAQIPHVMHDRARIAERYRTNLQSVPGITLMPVNPRGPDTPWVFGVLTESKAKRKSLRQILASNGYETRDYFFPLHLQPMCPNGATVLPNAEDMGSRGFYLPTFYGLSNETIDSICSCLKLAI